MSEDNQETLMRDDKADPSENQPTPTKIKTHTPGTVSKLVLLPQPPNSASQIQLWIQFLGRWHSMTYLVYSKTVYGRLAFITVPLSTPPK